MKSEPLDACHTIMMRKKEFDKRFGVQHITSGNSVNPQQDENVYFETYSVTRLQVSKGGEKSKGF